MNLQLTGLRERGEDRGGADVCGPTACLGGVTDDTYDALDMKRIAMAPMSPKINDEQGEWGLFICFLFLQTENRKCNQN